MFVCLSGLGGCSLLPTSVSTSPGASFFASVFFFRPHFQLTWRLGKTDLEVIGVALSTVCMTKKRGKFVKTKLGIGLKTASARTLFGVRPMKGEICKITA